MKTSRPMLALRQPRLERGGEVVGVLEVVVHGPLPDLGRAAELRVRLEGAGEVDEAVDRPVGAVQRRLAGVDRQRRAGDGDRSPPSSCASAATPASARSISSSRSPCAASMRAERPADAARRPGDRDGPAHARLPFVAAFAIRAPPCPAPAGGLALRRPQRHEDSMATAPACDFGWKAPDFSLPATDGKTYSLSDISGPEGHADRVHLQPLPLRDRRHRPDRRDARELQELRHRRRRDLLERCAELPGGRLRPDGRVRQGAPTFPSPICTTRASRSRAPMTRSARRISSASTPIWGCNTAAGSTRAARVAKPGARRELYEAMLQVAETGRGPAPSRRPRWAARSSGRRPDGLRRGSAPASPRPPPPGRSP